jgi:hypothetical protein
VCPSLPARRRPLACAVLAPPKRELALFEEWTPKTLRDQQQTLADWGLDRWAVEEPGAEEIEPEEAAIESETDDVDRGSGTARA